MLNITDTRVIVATAAADWEELVRRYNALDPTTQSTITLDASQQRLTVVSSFSEAIS